MIKCSSDEILTIPKYSALVMVLCMHVINGLTMINDGTDNYLLFRFDLKLEKQYE